jgi:hypothetical protein
MMKAVYPQKELRLMIEKQAAINTKIEIDLFSGVVSETSITTAIRSM